MNSYAKINFFEYRDIFGIKFSENVFNSADSNWTKTLQEGLKTVEEWNESFLDIKEDMIKNYKEPWAIPQFQVNSNIKPKTQMQTNLEWVIRSRANSRKAYSSKHEINEKFQDDIFLVSGLSKDARYYLINAIFWNFSEIDESIKEFEEQKTASNEDVSSSPLSEYNLLNLHSLIFKLVLFFWKTEREKMIQVSKAAGSEQLLFEYWI
jgi:hypothetical protein